MSTTPELNYYGRRLIRKIRALREEVKLTQTQAGESLHMTLQKISRIETGQLPGFHELRAMLNLYGVPDEEHSWYEDLHHLAKRKDWWRQFGMKKSSYVAMENEAVAMLEFRLGVIPELMQTEQYAHELAENLISSSHRDVDTEVAVILERQKRLHDDHDYRLTVHSIVHEPVLRQGCNRAQLRHLVDCAELSNVTVQILPQSVGFHPGLAGSMILLGFAEADQSDQVFATDIFGEFELLKDHALNAVSQALKGLELAAMTPADSLLHLKRLARIL